MQPGIHRVAAWATCRQEYEAYKEAMRNEPGYQEEQEQPQAC